MMIVLLVAALIIISPVPPAYGNDIVIEEHPLSLLIPANEVVTFKCRANCVQTTVPCRGYWFLNDTHDFHPTINMENCSTFSGAHICQSLKIEQHSDSNGFSQELILTVNASVYVNDTQISCRYRPSGDTTSDKGVISKSATLLVISNPPVSPNPTLRTDDATHITLLWSPPFLWPGHRIQTYNVSLLTLSGEVIGAYSVNSTYTNAVVSLTVDMCLRRAEYTGFKFVVSASNASNVTLQSISISTTNVSSSVCSTEQVFSTPESLGNSNGGTDDVLSYKIATIVGVLLAVVFLLTLIAVVSCAVFLWYKKKQKEKKVNGTKDRLCKTMILNPIYDGNGHALQSGPVYEDIKPPEPKGTGPGPDYRVAPMTTILQTELNKLQLSHTFPRSSSNKDYPVENTLSPPQANGGYGNCKVTYGNFEYYDV